MCWALPGAGSKQRRRNWILLCPFGPNGGNMLNKWTYRHTLPSVIKTMKVFQGDVSCLVWELEARVRAESWVGGRTPPTPYTCTPAQTQCTCTTRTTYTTHTTLTQRTDTQHTHHTRHMQHTDNIDKIRRQHTHIQHTHTTNTHTTHTYQGPLGV